MQGHPAREERAVLSVFRRLLGQKEPASETNLIDLPPKYLPKLGETGFPPRAYSNLLFHAALRLEEQGLLTSHVDPPREGEAIYHRRQFSLTPDTAISVALCEDCHDQLQYSSSHLHRRCAVRLRKALDRVLPRPNNSRKAGKRA